MTVPEHKHIQGTMLTLERPRGQKQTQFWPFFTEPIGCRERQQCICKCDKCYVGTDKVLRYQIMPRGPTLTRRVGNPSRVELMALPY